MIDRFKEGWDPHPAALPLAFVPATSIALARASSFA
jgi:hypothetical protein